MPKVRASSAGPGPDICKGCRHVKFHFLPRPSVSMWNPGGLLQRALHSRKEKQEGRQVRETKANPIAMAGRLGDELLKVGRNYLMDYNGPTIACRCKLQV